MKAIWTLDGDETSWSAWAENMALALATRFMLDIIAANPAPGRGWALDIGCGTGRAFTPLAEAGSRVTGIDPTVNGLLLSKGRVSHSQSNVYPLLATGAYIPLASESISFVLALSTLFHLSLEELRIRSGKSTGSFFRVVGLRSIFSI